MSLAWRKCAAALICLAGCLLTASPALANTHARKQSRTPAQPAHAGTTFLSQPTYQANENIGHLPITIERTTNLSQPEVVYYGVNLSGAQAGQNFDPIPSTRAVIPAGRGATPSTSPSTTRGSTGRLATRPRTSPPEPGHARKPSKADVQLLQNDPLQNRDAENPLGYCRHPPMAIRCSTCVWYVFGDAVASREAVAPISTPSSNPAWAQALIARLLPRLLEPTASGCGTSPPR